MALQLQKTGEGYTIQTAEEAKQALEMALEIEDEISEMYDDMKLLKSSVARWMARNHVKRIPTDGRYATVVQRSRRSWNGARLLEILKSEFPDEWKKLWQKFTVRIPDSDKINEAVKKEPHLMEVISEAYEESKDKPFIQVYDE